VAVRREREKKEREEGKKTKEKGEKPFSSKLSPVERQPLAELVSEDEGADREQRGAPPAALRASSRGRGRRDGQRGRRRSVWPRKEQRSRGVVGGVVDGDFGGSIRSRHAQKRRRLFALHRFVFYQVQEDKGDRDLALSS